MDRRIAQIAARAFCLLLALAPLGSLRGDTAAASAPADFDALLQQGEELERSGRWGQAIQLYEDFSKRSTVPSPLLHDHLRHCEIRYGLTRRYHDASFRSKLLSLPRAQALKLYDEVSKKIDDYYVEPPDPKRLFQTGTENLLVACRDDDFRKANLAGVPENRLEPWCEYVRQWKARGVRDRAEARQAVTAIATQAELFGLKAAPVVLEFIYGSCDALDDYSTYLTPDRLTDLYAVIDGNFVGIGVELRSDSEGLLIVNALAGGPAVEAGMRNGDHIVAIGSVATAGLTTEEAANQLQGTAGSTVALWIRSRGDSAPRRVILRRRSVDVQSVSEVHLVSEAEGIGYIHLSAFQKTTLSELEHAVARLQAQHMRSLILDLRGNPGGLLTAAVDISDKFLNDGVIVSTRGRADGQTYTYRAHRGNSWAFPLVVLVDGDSASASEILAGAIQDNRRGTIVGVRSYGKGSVQSIFPLDTADAGIRLTTAKFFSPKGRPYAHQGVSPDMEVSRPTSYRESGTTISDLDPSSDPQLVAAIQASRQLIGSR